MGEGPSSLGKRFMVLAVAGALVTHGACETHQCTEIGCGDAATLTLRTADGTLPDGAYTLSLDVEGQTHTCAFAAPGDLPTEPGRIATASCDSELRVEVLPEVVCTEHRSGDAVSQSCTPVPDHWYFATALQGTPAGFTLAVERDGRELLNEQRALNYRDEQPNGPGCEPICRQAGVELTLAD
jgi:hypothetical protein